MHYVTPMKPAHAVSRLSNRLSTQLHPVSAQQHPDGMIRVIQAPALAWTRHALRRWWPRISRLPAWRPGSLLRRLQLASTSFLCHRFAADLLRAACALPVVVKAAKLFKHYQTPVLAAAGMGAFAQGLAACLDLDSIQAVLVDLTGSKTRSLPMLLRHCRV